MAPLKKIEKKHLLTKITLFVGSRLTYLNEVKRWSDAEVVQDCGVLQNRISEYKNFKKYQKPMSEKDLIRFIEGGIVTVNELQQIPDLTEKEQKYISNLQIYEDKALLNTINAALEDGLSKEELIQVIEAARRKKD